MRVLVTGATGFIGRRCVAALMKRGAEVHAVGRQSADLHDPAQRERLMVEVAPTHLLHLAWYVEPKLFWDSPENYRWVETTVELMRLFTRRGARAVLAGTSDEYDSRAGVLSEERTPAKPSSVYGACKHAAHMMSSAIAREAGVSLAWCRLFAAYGPGEPASKLV